MIDFKPLNIHKIPSISILNCLHLRAHERKAFSVNMKMSIKLTKIRNMRTSHIMIMIAISISISFNDFFFSYALCFKLWEWVACSCHFTLDIRAMRWVECVYAYAWKLCKYNKKLVGGCHVARMKMLKKWKCLEGRSRTLRVEWLWVYKAIIKHEISFPHRPHDYCYYCLQMSFVISASSLIIYGSAKILRRFHSRDFSTLF